MDYRKNEYVICGAELLNDEQMLSIFNKLKTEKGILPYSKDVLDHLVRHDGLPRLARVNVVGPTWEYRLITLDNDETEKLHKGFVDLLKKNIEVLY